ncbi:piggyBac transposable element-derived protein 1-like isoform X2 [Nothobranchius furzeri]|uniref:PiggyBac transposable element-derived protein domain-containing protein n=1 Tax=Nothobranchius furzeri TaxID=105023 RepID=A0A8C6L0K8_NOTFU
MLASSPLFGSLPPLHSPARPDTLHLAQRKVCSVLQSFLCLIDIGMLLTIRECTVQQARRTDPNWNLSHNELMAFISVLFAKAVMCQVGAMVDCWSENFLIPAVKETMSRDRFTSIMANLRFDTKDTRAERVKTDKFAAMSDVWSRFTKNCAASFSPGQHITVDRQLFPTKVHCPFTKLVTGKPNKVGIEFWMATDLETKYVCNAVPYLGKDPSRPRGELSEKVAMRLVEPFLDAGRNVTTDSFFTSLSLAHRLLQRNTTLLGTMTKGRRELPPPARDAAAREQFSTSVFKSGSVSLTVYAPTKKKTVFVLSSMHQHVVTGDDGKNKPNTITDYNYMKSGGDDAEQVARKYSVRTATRRWPVAVFYNMLDLAAANAYVLYKACTGSTDTRRLFLHHLAMELRSGFMREKASAAAADTTAATAAAAALHNLPNWTTQCQVRKNCNRNRSRFCCVKCHRYTCAKCREHENWVCEECK